MGNTVIIIPCRLAAKRLPNKPLLEINNLPMIIHVIKRAKESSVGDVIVATPDKKIKELVEKHSGVAILTEMNHETGTDRVYEVFQKISNKDVDIIINLQGDMPNLDPQNIRNLENLMRKSQCATGTLASDLKSTNEIANSNIVKVETNDGTISAKK